MLNIFELAKESYKKAQKNRENLNKIDALLADDDSEALKSTKPDTDSERKPQQKENTVLICGSSSCGKSHLIARFLDLRSDVLHTPTIALDYNYSTRTRNNVKELAHIWELGNGGLMADLLELTLNEENINNTSVFLFLDLTHPEEFQYVLEPILHILRTRLNQILSQINIRDPIASSTEHKNNFISNKLREHKDAKVIKPLEIPLAIVGARYDEFQKFDSERKRSIYRLIRTLAHLNGAILLSYSVLADPLVSRARSLLAHFTFKSAFGGTKLNVEVHEPIFVPLGADSLEEIGVDYNYSIENYAEAMSQWFYMLNVEFPQKDSNGLSGEDPALDKQFAEPRIDNLIEEKTRALEAYIKEKRNREEAQEKAEQRFAFNNDI